MFYKQNQILKNFDNKTVFYNCIHIHRSEILEWRNKERNKLFDKLNKALPDLDSLIAEKIEGMNLLDTFNRTEFHNRIVAPAVEEWFKIKFKELSKDIKISAEKSGKILVLESTDKSWSNSEITTKGLLTVATFAPIAGIPAAIATATITTTSFFIFTTSTISIPVLLISLAGLAATGVGANEIRRQTFKYFQDKYLKETQTEARKKVIRPVRDHTSFCMWSLLTNEIDEITKGRLENLL